MPTDYFYLEEANQRIHYYPPPFAGVYFEPWLWYDGDQHGGFLYALWESMITARMAMPAPVTIAMWGDYTPGTGQGTVNVYLQNDSTATINGRVIIVITEDNLFYMAPNGVNWHNHVPRDYLPDHNGIMVSIPASGYEIVTQPFTINSLWNDNYCTILAWIQNDSMQVDSTKEIWQGAMKKVTELGIEETYIDGAISQFSVSPNPCRDRVAFAVNLPSGTEYRVEIYDILGRQVRGLVGVSTGKHTIVEWDLNTNHGKKVDPGVYLFEFITDTKKTSGKIVVK
jgi:hypothetical protein